MPRKMPAREIWSNKMWIQNLLCDLSFTPYTLFFIHGRSVRWDVSFCGKPGVVLFYRNYQCKHAVAPYRQPYHTVPRNVKALVLSHKKRFVVLAEQVFTHSLLNCGRFQCILFVNDVSHVRWQIIRTGTANLWHWRYMFPHRTPLPWRPTIYTGEFPSQKKVKPRAALKF